LTLKLVLGDLAQNIERNLNKAAGISKERKLSKNRFQLSFLGQFYKLTVLSFGFATNKHLQLDL